MIQDYNYIFLTTYDWLELMTLLLIKAFLPEVPVIVEEKCCAGVTPESHRTALASMKSCQNEII